MWKFDKTFVQRRTNDLFSSPNMVRVIKSRMRWARLVARIGERRDVYRVLVRKPKGKRPLGRPRHRWKDNIKMNLHEIECGGMDWIDLAQDRNRLQVLVNALMNLRVSKKCGEFLNQLKIG